MRDRALLELRDARRALESPVSSLNTRANECNVRAVDLAKQDKARALQALRTAKVLREERTQKEALLHQVVVALEQLHGAALTQRVLASLRSAASALQNVHENGESLEDAQIIMDDLVEAVQQQSELNEALTQPLEADEEQELEEELAALREEDAKGKVPVIVTTPAVNIALESERQSREEIVDLDRQLNELRLSNRAEPAT